MKETKSIIRSSWNSDKVWAAHKTAQDSKNKTTVIKVEWRR